MTYSRDNPSPRYRELLEQYRAMHRDGDLQRGIAAEKMFSGMSLPPQARRIKALVARAGAKTLLDYGCGKASAYRAKFVDGAMAWNGVREYWGVAEVRLYDPGYAPHSELPTGTFNGVICTDVLEHCPEEDLGWIVGELFAYAERFVFANVACYPAGKTLPNGENAHCTIRPTDFWHALFASAAASRPGMLWEVWASVGHNDPAGDTRLANFAPSPAPAAAPVGPALWRLS